MTTQLLQPVQGLRRSALMQSGADIFRRMCGLEIVPVVATWWPPSFVLATVPLEGRCSWMLCLAVPRSVAPELASRLNGFDIPYDSRDMDAAMETLADMIAADLQDRLRRRGERIVPLSARAQRHEDGFPLPALGDVVKQFTFDSHIGPLVLAVVETDR